MYVGGGAILTRRALGAVVKQLKTNAGMHESEKMVNMLVL
jgi:hypothetical protein